MSRVLVVVPELPWPLDKGGRLRGYHLLKGLASDHVVHLVSTETSRSTADRIAGLGDLVASVTQVPPRATRMGPLLAWSAISGRPLIALRWSPADLADVIEAHIAGSSVDAVAFFGHPTCGQLLPLAVPTVVDFHDVLTSLYQRTAAAHGSPRRRLYAAWQSRMMRSFEKDVARHATRVVTVSEEDRAALESMAPGCTVRTIPNGVDTDEFQPLSVSSQPVRIVFVGSFDYFPNSEAARWLLHHVMPAVWALEPTSRLRLVGRAPPRWLVDAGNDPRVDVAWNVPDIRVAYADATVVLVPLRIGGGTRVKALEAAAMGLPIVGTRVGLEGLPFLDGGSAIFAETENEFAVAIQRIASDPQLRARLGTQARALAERHSWKERGSEMAELVGEVCQRASPRH